MRHLSAGVAGLVLAGIAGPAAAATVILGEDGWVQTDQVGANPIVRTARHEVPLAATGRIEVREISGSVEVTLGKDDAVVFVHERKAATRQDDACQALHYEHAPERLRIWLERKPERACRVIHATDTLTLAVPRRAEVVLREIGDSVRATGLEGRLWLESVGDSVHLKDVQQVRADSIGDSVRIEVSRLGPAGIKVGSVGDMVNLYLPEAIDARLRIGSVGDEIRGPGLRLTSMEDRPFDMVLGKGGPTIEIDSVGDSVAIRSGPRLGPRTGD